MTIQFKRSNTPDKIPLIGDMLEGELNFNTHDGRVFFKKTVNGIPSLVTLSQTPNFIAGNGVLIDSAVDNNGQTNVTISSSSAGTQSLLIKTFNILNEFTAPLIGNSIYIPESSTTIRSVQLTNGRGPVTVDLMVGLYRNNDLLNFFTIPAGNITKKYADLEYFITPGDYITVNIVSGCGQNFSMALFNT